MRFIGVEPIGKNPYSASAAQLSAGVDPMEVCQARCDSSSAPKTCRYRVDLLLDVRRVSLKQRRHLSQPCMEHKHARLEGNDECSGDPKKQLGVGFHRPADIDKKKHLGPFAANSAP